MSLTMTRSILALFLLIDSAQGDAHMGTKAEDEIYGSFDKVGSGFCTDDDGLKGSGEEEPTLEKAKACCPLQDIICARRCAAIDWCQAFSDMGENCEYYRIDISTADGKAGGNCYKKKPPPESTSAAPQAALGAFALLAALVSYMM